MTLTLSTVERFWLYHLAENPRLESLFDCMYRQPRPRTSRKSPPAVSPGSQLPKGRVRERGPLCPQSLPCPWIGSLPAVTCLWPWVPVNHTQPAALPAASTLAPRVPLTLHSHFACVFGLDPAFLTRVTTVFSTSRQSSQLPAPHALPAPRP